MPKRNCEAASTLTLKSLCSVFNRVGVHGDLRVKSLQDFVRFQRGEIQGETVVRNLHRRANAIKQGNGRSL